MPHHWASMSTTSRHRRESESSALELPSRRAYKVGEVAAVLGVTSATVRRLIARGFLRSCRALRHVLIPAEQVEEFLRRESGQTRESAHDKNVGVREQIKRGTTPASVLEADNIASNDTRDAR